MRIGIPRERKKLEKRVAITPLGAKELIAAGATVIIESGAGEGSFFSDEDYRSVGAQIVPTLEEVWKQAELLVKVKEPHVDEFPYFRSSLVLFDYLHLAGEPQVTAALVQSGMTALGYELVQTDDKRLPLLEPMSEIAGRLSIINGANHLLSQHGGRGVLMGGSSGAPPASVLIIGGGVAGTAAARAAHGLGSLVTVLDRSPARLALLRASLPSEVRCLESTPEVVNQELPRTDLLIGAVLIPGAHAPKVVTEQQIRLMRHGSVVVDISIDQGGCIETSRVTSLAEPTFTLHGVIHYGVPNMPAQTPRTSTLALTNATLPYIKAIATKGLEQALREDQALARAVAVKQGKLN